MKAILDEIWGLLPSNNEAWFKQEVKKILTAHEGEWISVDDKSPENGDYIETLEKRNRYWFEGHRFSSLVTHWRIKQPLPATPKEGA